PTLAGPLRQATIRTAVGHAVSPTVSALAATAAGRLSGAGRAFALMIVSVGLLACGLALHPGAREKPPDSPPAVASRDQQKRKEDARPATRLPAGAVARFGWSPLRIGNSAYALAPDGKTVVAVSPEGIVRRFDASNGRLLE